jgi:hypothetical protein
MASGPRCGDEAKIEYEVSGELVGKPITTVVHRTKKWTETAIYTEKAYKKKKFVWPDLDKGLEGLFYGGRQVDWKGLDKESYQSKFSHQEFALALYQGHRFLEDAGATLVIEQYPDVGREHKEIGIPLTMARWTSHQQLSLRDGIVRTYYLSSDSLYDSSPGRGNCGNFHIELKDGVCVITVKLTLVKAGTSQEESPRVFRYVKKRSEAFWNSTSSGYNQWVHHRSDCKRKKDCNCSLITDKKGDYTSAGCCKIPIKLNVEEGSDNRVQIVRLNPAQREEAAQNILGLNRWGATGTQANTGLFYYPENRVGTYAHERGHMMGFPDQYPTGAIVAGAMSIAGPTGGGAFPIDDSSIMGMSQGRAQRIHAEASWISGWIGSKCSDSFDVIGPDK